MGEEVSLKVGELTNREEFGRGIVRIDNRTMHTLGIKEGDIVELQGEKKTGAIAIRAYPADIGLNIIRMDGLTRRNAGIGVGETVKVKKADVKEAKRVVLAPIQKGVRIHVDPEPIKRNLFMRPVTKGDIITPFPVVRQKATSPFEDFFPFGINIEDLFTPIPGEIKLMVVMTNPDGIVKITERTEIEIKPEAVDIELKAIPTITYEDIGGLHDAIQKIREMVELPLRHPELFERLGIDPPKGVLLYGPPGTGKTLLAKAVANESGASFHSISGPEIMCVDGKTNIFTNPNGFVKAEELFENDGVLIRNGIIKVKELKSPISTFSFTPNGIEKGKITHVTKLIAPAYKISFDDGVEIVGSHNQPFLVYENGGFKWKRLRDLKEGEFVVKLDKIKLPTESVKIEIKNIPYLVERNGKYAIRSNNLNRSNFIKLPEQTNKKLMEFIGLLVSEGSIFEDSVVFSNNDKFLRKRFKHLLKMLFGIEKTKEYDTRIVVYSKVLVKYLELLGFTKKKKLTIPNYFYKLPKEEIQSFVKGYFEGDGSVGIVKSRKINYTTPILYSKNEEFLKELKNLMHLKLGIATKLKKHKTPKGLMYKLVVRGREGRKEFAKISKTGKFKKLQEIKKIKGNREFKKIPFPELLVSAIRTKLPYSKYRNLDTYVYHKMDLTKHALQKLYEVAKENNILTKRIEREYESLLRDDICFTKITKIEYLGKKELYDFTVDKDSFIADLLLLHNSKYYGQSEENIRKIFTEAQKNAPSIIFIDEIDAIAPKREEVTGEVERRVVSQLLALMDGLKSRGKVIVIAATNRPNALDPALRRPGRFDREIEIGVPDKKGRKEILQIHTRNMPLTKDVDLDWLASVTYGYVGADLEVLAKEAAMAALRRTLPEISWKKHEKIPQKLLEKLKVTKADFEKALKVVEPSAMREVLIEIPNIKWNDIGGLENIKSQLKEIVEWPLKYPDSFKRMGIKPPTGVLLYGPPGTGKTLLAKAVANESGANFISIRGPEITSKWVGESERKVREIFRRAKQVAPAIIFFDEIDSIVPKRGLDVGTRAYENIVSQILVEMSGLEELHDVVVIAATNRPDIIDPALLRPGRFERQIFVPAPDMKGREEIFKIYLKKMPVKGVDAKKLAKKTEGYTGADIEAVCREAGLNALRKDIKAKYITMKDFEKAIKKIGPSVNEKMMDYYKKMTEYFKSPVKRETKKNDKGEIRYVG
jgi:SpoVK/Ycf46/Vps4 family AAA+-type ATPase